MAQGKASITESGIAEADLVLVSGEEPEDSFQRLNTEIQSTRYQDSMPKYAENLNDNLLRKCKKGQYEDAVKLARDTFPQSLKDDDILTLSNELEKDYPLCAIFLHYIACRGKLVLPVLHSTHITIIRRIACEVMDSSTYSDDVRYINVNAAWTLMEEVRKLLQREAGTTVGPTKITNEAKCVVNIAGLIISSVKETKIFPDPSILATCQRRLAYFEQEFRRLNDSILLQDIIETQQQLDKFNSAGKHKGDAFREEATNQNKDDQPQEKSDKQHFTVCEKPIDDVEHELRAFHDDEQKDPNNKQAASNDIAFNKNNEIFELIQRSKHLQLSLPTSTNSMLSPDNCFGVTALAGHTDNCDLLNQASEYVTENVETILSSGAFQSLDMANFEKYLDVCCISDHEMLQLITAKICPKPGDYICTENDSFSESELYIIKTAAALSSEYRTLHTRLREYCQRVLKQQLSKQNCLDTAILAYNCRLDELKIWAEYLVLINFPSILSNARVNANSEEEITQFCKISSIPVDLTDATLDPNITCSKEHYEQSVLEEMASDWLMVQLDKLPSIKTEVITTDGGVIELDGCSVAFLQGSVTKSTEFVMSVNTDPEKYPKSGVMITPILTVESSTAKREKRSKPVMVTMPTSFRASDGKRVAAHLFSNDGDGWQHEADIFLHDKYEINFLVTHFSDYVVGIQEANGMNFRLQNDIFIHIHTGLITSWFYKFDTEQRNILKIMRAQSCSSFSTQTLCVQAQGYDDDSVIRMEIMLNRPEPAVAIPHESWLPRCASTKKICELGKCSFSVDPGDAVRNLPPKSYVSGIYKVFVGDCGELEYGAMNVMREWPIQLDPEITDPPNQLVAGKVAMEGGVIHESNERGITYIGGYIPSERTERNESEPEEPSKRDLFSLCFIL